MYSLAQRVAALDSGLGTGLGEDVDQFIRVLSEVVSFGTETVSSMPRLRPADADGAISECHLLARLASAAPEIVNGPLARSRQYWISAEKPPHLPPNERELSVRHFRSAMEAPPVLSTKPFGFGLYTSTGFGESQGMWRAYLDMYEASEVPPPVWYVWSLSARSDAAVIEIASATDWAMFVDRFPIEDKGWIYPNWKAVAHAFDAVHVTVKAIAAIQGICFYTQNGVTAPTYWDVETTFWLRWPFETVGTAEVVGDLDFLL